MSGRAGQLEFPELRPPVGGPRAQPVNSPPAAVPLEGAPGVKPLGTCYAMVVLCLLLHAFGLFLGESRTAQPIARSAAQLRLDPNLASDEELQLLPGVGPALSRNIIEYRSRSANRAAFASAEDLDAVKRIGPAIVEKLRPFLRFGEGNDAVDAGNQHGDAQSSSLDESEENLQSADDLAHGSVPS